MAVQTKRILLYSGMYLLTLSYSPHKNSTVDIADTLGKPDRIAVLIQSHFVKVEYGTRNPIIGYKVDFVNQDSLSLSSMPVVQCWATQKDTSYSFYILINKSHDPVTTLTQRFGPIYSEATIGSSGDIVIADTIYCWKWTGVTVFLLQYYNISHVPKYEKCYEIICGNMKLDQMLNKAPNISTRYDSRLNIGLGGR